MIFIKELKRTKEEKLESFKISIINTNFKIVTFIQ